MRHPTLRHHTRQHHTARQPALAAGLLLGMLAISLLSACGSTTGSGALHSLTLGLTYIPNVQFAPFYVAEQQGYYRAAGLNVTLRHHSFAEDEFGALVAHQEDVIIGSGDEILQARDKKIDVAYIDNIFTTYPVTLIVPDSSPIHTIADLKGHSIGVPGPYGATYIGLLAMLKSAGLTTADVTIQSIQYTQVPALTTNKVDAVMGYLNNEPIQFQQSHFAIRTITGPGLSDLISNGLAALATTLSSRADDIKKLISATLQGVQYTIAHPDQAITSCQTYVPDLTGGTRLATAKAVLHASLPIWAINTSQPGYIDPQAWQGMASFMQSQGLLSAAAQLTGSYSNAYLPETATSGTGY